MIKIILLFNALFIFSGKTTQELGLEINKILRKNASIILQIIRALRKPRINGSVIELL